MGNKITNSIVNRIYDHGRGWVFTPKHFSDLGSYTGIRQALSRLQKEGFIRRVSQGIYYYPRIHKTLGELSPSVDEVAKTIAEKNGAKIQASGAYAANLIGLSEQVPGKVVYLTDGPTGKVKIGNLEIAFKKTTVKNMFAAGSKEALVIQALKFIKIENIDEGMLKVIRIFLNETTRKEFEKNTKYAPHWIKVLLFNAIKDKL